MKISFEDTDLYLCNPDGEQICFIDGVDRTVKLRYNDLSELSFGCYSFSEAYENIEARRLVYGNNIGWFLIVNVNDVDEGNVSRKDVMCYSLQAMLKSRGFYCEERAYYLYNPSDPLDSDYDPKNTEDIPSVVGQLYQQLGIGLDLVQDNTTSLSPYDEWTITFIDSTLEDRVRSFKESTTYGYDWIVGDVEKAFGVTVLFDFSNRTIRFINPANISTDQTENNGIVFSFSNFMQEIEIEEDANDIVTVMNVSGDNCDIAGVNPTGANFICDFSHYKEWMSQSLVEKLENWDEDIASAKPTYESKVLQLREQYANLTSIRSRLQEISKIYTDLSAAVANKSMAYVEGAEPNGIVWCETVDIGSKSIDESSVVHTSALTDDLEITVYKNRPTYNAGTGMWTVSGSSYTGTVKECFEHVDTDFQQYLYFIDNQSGTSGKSYCVLYGTARVNQETLETQYVCKGYKRYISLSIANEWMTKYDAIKASLHTTENELLEEIKSKKAELETISSALNIVHYFDDSPELLKELYCYWIEGDYSNDGFSVINGMSQEEVLDIENELLDTAYIQLAKVSQPKFQFSLSSINFAKCPEALRQVESLILGKKISVERREGVWYYPTLLEVDYSMDDANSFSLRFSNDLKFSDFAYEYGELLSGAVSTSRQVSSNWQDLIAYSKERGNIDSLVKDPLSTTLRASFANMDNQEFIVDNTGILGRKFSDATSKDGFVDEQMRIMNNVILFTDDNWDTVKTALGKVYYKDAQGRTQSTYGLAAETIVGSLLVSEKLRIQNDDSTIDIGSNGIVIKQTDGTVVFSAKPDGSTFIQSYATQAAVDSVTGEVDEARGNYAKLSLRIDAIEQTVSGGNYTYQQAAVPTNAHSGDLWYNTGAYGYTINKWYRYNGTSWVVITDGEIATATSNIARLTVDVNGISTTVSSHTTEIAAQDVKIQYAQSQIEQQAGQIQLKVSTSTYNAKMDEIDVSIEDLDGRVTGNTSTITQEANKIALVVEETVSGNVVKAASIVTAINEAGSSVKIDADHITLSGDVVLKSNLTDGTTQISGSNIKTGTIDASSVTVSNLRADSITVGKLTAAQIDTAGVISNEEVTIKQYANDEAVLVIGSLSLSTATKQFTGSFTTDTPAAYGFILQPNGWYVSQAVPDNLFALIEISFTTTEYDQFIVFDCVSDGEDGYDYGIVGKLDTHLTLSKDEDTAKIFKSFISAADCHRIVQVVVPIGNPGNHFIQIKYRKDVSASRYSDTMRFRVVKTAQSATLTLSKSGASISSTNIDFSGKVTFADLEGSGTTIINGDNITTGVIKSANYSSATMTGMMINLSNGFISTGSGKFSVNADGEISATGATINGVLSAGVGSNIGNFLVDENGNLSLTTTENLSNVFRITKTYNNKDYVTVLSTGAIQLRTKNSDGELLSGNSITLNTEGSPRFVMRDGGTTSFVLEGVGSDLGVIRGSSLEISDVDNPNSSFGVYRRLNSGEVYHILGITGQVHANVENVGFKWFKFDKGLLTGARTTQYNTTDYPVIFQ